MNTATSASKTESHKFTVHPAIIYSLITAQASGVQKALLELIMNSVDAGATRIDVELTENEFSVIDNGSGFKDLSSIESCFGTFGTPHKQGDAAYGKFRIGRSQCMGYASTIWHSNEFKMEVDLNVSPEIESYGYTLSEVEESYKGCKITGVFYEPIDLEVDDFSDKSIISPYHISNPVEALRVMLKYLEVPVYINGKKANIDLNNLLPMSKTKHGLFFLQKTSSRKGSLCVNIYNKGVYAFTIDSYCLTGDVVSLNTLDLNMARNEAKTTCSATRSIKNKINSLQQEITNLNTNAQVDDLNELEKMRTEFVKTFWNKMLSVNKEFFYEYHDLCSSFKNAFIKMPNDTTSAINQIYHCLSKDINYADLQRQNTFILFDPSLFTGEELINSTFDNITIKSGYIPYNMLPDRQFMQYLEGEFSLDLLSIIEFDLPFLSKAYEKFDEKAFSVSIAKNESIESKYTKLLKLLLIVLVTIDGCSIALRQARNYDESEYLGHLIPSCSNFTIKYYEKGDVTSKLVDQLEVLLLTLNTAPMFNTTAHVLETEWVDSIRTIVKQSESIVITDFEGAVLKTLQGIIDETNEYSGLDYTENATITINFQEPKRRLILQELPKNIYAQTDSLNFIALNLEHFRACVSNNDYVALVMLIMHELSHDSEEHLTKVHGEQFYLRFHVKIEGLARYVETVESKLQAFILRKTTLSKFTERGVMPQHLNHFLKRFTLELKPKMIF